MAAEHDASLKSAKQESLEVISRLSDDASMDDVLYALDVLKAMREGEDDVANGRLLTQAEVEERIHRWRASSGPRALPRAST
jgi:hypothetical protein